MFFLLFFNSLNCFVIWFELNVLFFIFNGVNLSCFSSIEFFFFCLFFSPLMDNLTYCPASVPAKKYRKKRIFFFFLNELSVYHADTDSRQTEMYSAPADRQQVWLSGSADHGSCVLGLHKVTTGTDKTGPRLALEAKSAPPTPNPVANRIS